MSEARITFVDAPDASRYEIHDGEAVIGFAEYLLPDADHVDFTHTEVDEAYAGQGLAGDLVAFALADVRAAGKRIIPHCPYVAKWIAKHTGQPGTDYSDITDEP